MWGEKLYGLLPVPLQNLAVSLKGRQFHADRYQTVHFKTTAQTLARNEQLSLPDLKDLQFVMFREFAEHCFENSSYYRRLWQSHGLDPNQIRKPEDIARAPIVSKQELRAHTREFLAQPIRRRMTPVHTSGTTGSPLTVYFSCEDIGRRHAFLDRCRGWAGVQIGQKRATFTGRNIIPQEQSEPPFWRYNRGGRQMLFSSYHLLPDNLNAYVDALEKFAPEIIDGYPSAIHIVAEHILRRGDGQRIRPQAILVSAETVLPHQREAIERAFAAKLYNQYSSSEGAPFISECRNGRLHVHLDSGVIEILDRDGHAALPGQVGEMVVTSFTTHVTPLLRYAIGDIAIPAPDEDPCPCGLPFPSVEAIVGRIDDVLWTEDRGFVGRMDTVFKGVPSTIREAQIVQTSPETFVLRVVPDPFQYRRDHAEKVVAEMRRKLGDRATIRIEEVAEISRSANGKMRPVINGCSGLLPKSLRYIESSDASLVSRGCCRQD